MVDYLFVYGTLRSGAENPYARRLRAEAQLVAAATVRGSIFQLGSYPGYRPQPDGVVNGEVYRIADPARVLAIFDDYEGPNYTRIRIPVSTGEFAWTYQYNMQPPVECRISSGDFLAG